jgi:hypothetical protein
VGRALPFTRNAHERLVAGLGGAADWDVRAVPAEVKDGWPMDVLRTRALRRR